MRTKQHIAIIGATGSMGSAISKSLCRGNYRLLLCGQDTKKTEKLLAEIRRDYHNADVTIAPCIKEASWEAEIIILAVPCCTEKEIAERIRKVVNQKIIISLTNPVHKDLKSMVTDVNSSATEALQQLLPYAKVIKAFCTTFAADFETPVIDGNRLDAFIAGNDTEALENVSELISCSGFNPVIVGDLSASQTLERMQFLLIQLDLKMIMAEKQAGKSYIINS